MFADVTSCRYRGASLRKHVNERETAFVTLCNVHRVFFYGVQRPRDIPVFVGMHSGNGGAAMTA